MISSSGILALPVATGSDTTTMDTPDASTVATSTDTVSSGGLSTAINIMFPNALQSTVTPSTSTTNTPTVDSTPAAPVDGPIDSILQVKIDYLKHANILHSIYTRLGVMQQLPRREALMLLARFARIEPDIVPNKVYDDVEVGDELAGYVSACIREGLLTPQHDFRPDDSITRAEFVKLLVEFSNLPTPPVSASLFSDVDANSTFAPYIGAFIHALGGVTGDTFDPDHAMERRDAYSVLYAYMVRTNTK